MWMWIGMIAGALLDMVRAGTARKSPYSIMKKLRVAPHIAPEMVGSALLELRERAPLSRREVEYLLFRHGLRLDDDDVIQPAPLPYPPAPAPKVVPPPAGNPEEKK